MSSLFHRTKLERSGLKTNIPEHIKPTTLMWWTRTLTSKSADWENVLAQLSYKVNGDVLTTYLWCTNMMNQITPVLQEQWIAVSEREGAGRNRALRHEQKSVA